MIKYFLIAQICHQNYVNDLIQHLTEAQLFPSPLISNLKIILGNFSLKGPV